MKNINAAPENWIRVYLTGEIRIEADVRWLTSSISVILEANVSDGGELPPLWPTSHSGERKDLDQDMGCCDQDGAAGAVPAEQWTGETTANLTPECCGVPFHNSRL